MSGGGAEREASIEAFPDQSMRGAHEVAPEVVAALRDHFLHAPARAVARDHLARMFAAIDEPNPFVDLRPATEPRRVAAASAQVAEPISPAHTNRLRLSTSSS